MAEKAVAERGVSIALAGRAFCVSETCYRYSPKLDKENERNADLLVGLTQARRGWGIPRQSGCDERVNQDEKTRLDFGMIVAISDFCNA